MLNSSRWNQRTYSLSGSLWDGPGPFVPQNNQKYQKEDRQKQTHMQALELNKLLKCKWNHVHSRQGLLSVTWRYLVYLQNWESIWMAGRWCKSVDLGFSGRHLTVFISMWIHMFSFNHEHISSFLNGWKKYKTGSWCILNADVKVSIRFYYSS